MAQAEASVQNGERPPQQAPAEASAAGGARTPCGLMSATTCLHVQPIPVCTSRGGLWAEARLENIQNIELQ